MRILDISQFDNTLVLHFETEGKRINAYTLASTLVSIADAAKAANSSINTGYDVEIVVEALGPGSFRVKISAIYTKARNLFSVQRLETVALGILASVITQRYLSIDDSMKVVIKTNEVLVERGDERLIVPRDVYDFTRNVEKNPQFVQAIEKTIKVIGDDESVKGFGFVKEIDSPPPDIIMPKAILQRISIDIEEEPLLRTISEQCSLHISKAILEKGRQKWEFVWRGVKISAPILDEEFYTQFSAHEITIAPGDELEVCLSFKQKLDKDTGIYTTISYEVTEVIKHVPGIKQQSLGIESGD